MRVRLVRRPGQHGTRAYVEQYGERLICVRYRYDEASRRRYKTIEIVVEEGPWEPKAVSPSPTQARSDEQKQKLSTAPAPPELSASTLVGVRVTREEIDLQQHLLAVGARWSPIVGLWRVPYEKALSLGLAERIVGTIAELTATKARGKQGR